MAFFFRLLFSCTHDLFLKYSSMVKIILSVNKMVLCLICVVSRQLLWSFGSFPHLSWILNMSGMSLVTSKFQGVYNYTWQKCRHNFHLYGSNCVNSLYGANGTRTTWSLVVMNRRGLNESIDNTVQEHSTDTKLLQTLENNERLHSHLIQCNHS